MDVCSGARAMSCVMPLEGAIISETLPSNAKYPHMFEVQNFNYLLRMKAADNNERRQ